MTTNRDRCPAPADLERLFWVARENRPLQALDSAIHEHVTRCDECSAAWREISELTALGRLVEPSPTWERREEIRTTLLSKIDDRAAAPRPSFAWRRYWFAPLAVAAAAVALWIAWPTPAPTPGHVAHRANVLEHEGARSIVVTEQPDEIVRLVDGTITVSVAPLGTNERFRVIAGDDELSADGAAFDVTARGDRLVAVRVIHGNVRILAASGPKDLHAGETWRSSMATASTDRTAITATTGSGASVPVATPPVAAPIASPPAAAASIASAPTVSAPMLTASRSEPPTIRARTVRAPDGANARPETTEPVIEPPAEAPPPIAPRVRSMAQTAFDQAWVALRAGDFKNAASAFERTVTMSHDAQMIEDATFWRAVALARGGEVGTAVHVLTAFTLAYPESARVGEASVMLGWMLFERGDRAEARLRFEVGTHDPSPRVRDSATAGLAAISKR